MKTDIKTVLERAFRHALDHLENLDKARVSATAELPELRARLFRPLTDEGVEPARVIDDLAADAAGGLIGSAGGRFFAWVIGGAVPAALAADWLTSVWDQNAALYACSPAGAVVEEACGFWLKQLLGLPAQASFALVSGCQMAHVTSLAAARHALLRRRDWDVERRGLHGAPPFSILCGHMHGSVERAVRLIGLGKERLFPLPVDEAGRLELDVLAAALEKHKHRPTIVVLQAGDINTGGFDRFAELVPVARQYGAWVHIDGAFGLWAHASPLYRHLLEGAVDGHKWLNVPYDSGYAFVADAEAHRSAMSHRADYLRHDAQARDQIDWNPEWSRRGRGFAIYAAIRQLGKKGIAEIVERTSRYADQLVSRIGALEGAEIISASCINQGLVRFLDPRPGATEADHDRRTNEVIAKIICRGEAYFEGTTWMNKRCMRISVCNWRTSDEDVARAVEAVSQALKN